MIDIGTYDYEEDIDLPKRSDYITPDEDTPDEDILYEDKIDTFQDYELTQCIVYELAIRNPRYKEEVDYVMEFYTQFKNEIDIAIIYFSKPIKGFISPDPKLHTRHPSRIKFSELKKLISNIEVIPFNLEKNTLEYREPKIFEEKFYELLDFIMENKPSKSINVPSFMLNDKPIDIVDIYEGDGFVVETKIQSKGIIDFELPKDKPYEALHSIMSSTTDKEFYDFVKKYDDVITPMDVSERLRRKDVIISHIQLYEKFKRPKLKLHSNTSKNLMVEIDLSRPEKEINAYIKHLQSSLRDNSDIITPMELLESLYEPGDVLLIDNEKKHTVSKARIFAEKLFVYDYITATIKNNKANNSFYEKQIRKIQDENEDDFYLNKTERIQEAKAHFMENKEITASRTLMEETEILEAIGAKTDTVRGHYDSINKLLIDERYKGLLSNI